MSLEQRRSLRSGYQCQVIVATKDKSCIAELENLSKSGCCIKKPADWNFLPNDLLNLYFIIDNNHVVDAEAMFIWDDGKKIGLQYLQAQAVPIQILDELE
ncbi:MAG: PilZ domain-containing protein [Arenimonas sp.]